VFATVFILLYAGHLAADYPCQTDHQACHKAQPGAAGWRANLAHAGTHVALCAAALALGVLALDVELTPARCAVALLWIGVTHAFIDRRWPIARWMSFARQTGFAQHGGAAHVDQTAHVLVLVVAAAALAA